MQETRGRLVELDVTADPALACLATYRAEIWCRTGGARQNGYDARARDERVANLKECDGLRSAASTRPIRGAVNRPGGRISSGSAP